MHDGSFAARALPAGEGIALVDRVGNDNDGGISLGDLGVSPQRLRSAEARAAINGTTAEAELLASGEVAEQGYFRAMAQALDLRFVETVDPDALILREHHATALLRYPVVRVARVRVDAESTMLLMAPERDAAERLARMLRRRPEMRMRIAIAAPSAIRAAVVVRARARMLRQARHGLFDTRPEHSARIVMTGRQGFVAGALVAGVIAGVLLAPDAMLLAGHAALSGFFLGCVLLRLLATRRRPEAPFRMGRIVPREMPSYTVLVALYREADIVPELMAALGKLVWPRSKLEIKLVCEADDRETIDALRALELRPFVEIVEVPGGGPRTKPKALSYAVQMSSGELIVLYDAEDRPHPFQLVEAWQRFAASDERLACLQAPLVISNQRRSLLARMFAFEYSGLFRGMLPFLSRNELILPLGGTSSHFRREVLDRVGAWDPFNVTEDADLGLRLKRFGFRTETISLPTLETAPENLREWVPQRTRWFKGWALTWLVHARDWRQLASELGPASFAVSQILFAGMVASALLHPLLIATLAVLAWTIVGGVQLTGFEAALLAIDLANIVLGYGAFLLLGSSTLAKGERRYLPLVALMTPFYWMLLSFAAWRAVLQLQRRPHFWEKTPHPQGRAREQD